MQAGAVDFEIERIIARHLAATTWDDLPEAARRHAERAVTWALAIALDGMTEPDQSRLVDYVVRLGGVQEATILGTGLRTSAEHAALIHGRAGKAWEQEDKYWVDETIGFGVGCCVVPAALAAAEARGDASGKDVLTAVALGIDLEARIIRPLGLGFILGRSVANATFVLGAYGAAAAAGKIFGLDGDGFLDALGLAHCQASGNYQGQVEGRGVSLQAGFAVRNGLSAARLASMGMPGPRASIAGSCGLYAVHYPNSKIDPKQVLSGLGAEFLNVNLGYKGYPCGVVAHPAIDAVLAARAEVAGRDIVAIEVYGPPSLNIMSVPPERKRAPNSAIEAQFSIPWAAACAMHDGCFTTGHYADQVIQNPAIRALAAKVSVIMDPAFRGTRLVVRLADGVSVEPPVVNASKGHPRNPLSTGEIEAMLIQTARRLGADEDRLARLVAQLRDFESVADIRGIMESLTSRALRR